MIGGIRCVYEQAYRSEIAGTMLAATGEDPSDISILARGDRTVDRGIGLDEPNDAGPFRPYVLDLKLVVAEERTLDRKIPILGVRRPHVAVNREHRRWLGIALLTKRRL